MQSVPLQLPNVRAQRRGTDPVIDRARKTGVDKPSDPLWGLGLFVFLAAATGYLLTKHRFTDAAINGVFLIPVVWWMLALFLRRKP